MGALAGAGAGAFGVVLLASIVPRAGVRRAVGPLLQSKDLGADPAAWISRFAHGADRFKIRLL